MDFGKIAPLYDLLLFCSSGNLIRRARNCYLSKILGEKEILIVGGGTGAFLLDLLRAGYAGHAIYLDPCPEMLCIAKEKIQKLKHRTKLLAKISFVQQSMEDFAQERQKQKTKQEFSEETLQNKFCAMTAFFFLDLFSGQELEKQLDAIETLMKRNSRLYFADFHLSSSSPLWHKVLIKILYSFFGFVSKVPNQHLADLHSLLKSRGWATLEKKSLLNGFLQSILLENQSQGGKLGPLVP